MCHNGLLYQEILLTKCFLISIGLYGLLQTQMQETSISLTRNSSAAIIRIMQLVHFGLKTKTSWRRGKLPRSFASLTLYRHIKAADQRTIIQQYTGRLWVSCYICYNEEGPGRVRPRAVPSSLYQM